MVPSRDSITTHKQVILTPELEKSKGEIKGFRNRRNRQEKEELKG
jgi:hypothetical protein